MPRKPKNENLKDTKKAKKTTEVKKEKNIKSKKNSNKATDIKELSSSNTKNKSSKKSVSKKITKNPIKKTSTKKVAEKKTTIKKSTTTKKTTTKNVATKKTTTKKVTAKKATTKKSTTTKKTTSSTKKKITSIEYYDLPYRYDQTTVKILAQTPKMLFVYWDISDKDRNNFIKKYGDNFFETTKPVLVIHNTTQNYTFEVDINDFANSWYLHINDSFCDYSIELGRRPISIDAKNDIKEDYVFIASSNVIEAPNDHILFDKQQQMVYFKNTKTNIVTAKDIINLYFLRNMGKIYNIYDLYKEIYKDEVILTNPSSGNPTSINPTSTFK